MIRNYLKTAFRNLLRNKSYTFINIIGLAIGITVCLAIFLIIQFEMSFDKFHSKKDRIYRVLTELHSEDGMHPTSGVPYALPMAMHVDFPAVTSSAVFMDGNDQIIIPNTGTDQTIKKFKEETGVFFAEPDFFEIFDYPLIAGDYKSLKDPGTAVITKETAERYYGDWKSAIGKTFTRNNLVYTVTGILATIPKNTDFQIKLVASYISLKAFTFTGDWVSVASNHRCYFLLPKGVTQSSMDARLKSFTAKYKKEESARNIQYSQSLSAVHYDPVPGNFLDRTISAKMINTLWLIAAFILLIACVNFINLATAQAVNRAKEVGVRKVLGGNRKQLKYQFYSETGIVTAIAILFAIALTTLVIPMVNSVLRLPLTFSLFNNFSVILFLIALGAGITLLAGFYPAIVLSRFNPITAFKSKLVAGRTKGISLRRGLVVFQFVIAQALIIGTLISIRQMEYFKNRPLGFDKHAIVNVSFPSDSIALTKLDYLHDELMKIQGIQSASFSYGSPSDDGNWYSNFRYNHAVKETDWGANLKWADANYLKTYNIPLVTGRNLLPSDTIREYLVNETLLKRLGITNPADAINQQLDIWGGQMPGPIVGVIKDFNAMSLRQAIAPVIVGTMKPFYSKAGLRIDDNDMTGTLKKVEALWNSVYPDYVYEPRFLDSTIANFYRDETRLTNLYKIFAVLAILLSCLGLYGLASFMAVQRIKEVGIRKVLGASVKSIIMLFSKEFLLLIGIAFLIATPIAWYFMHDWLQDFVYRVNISWWILLLSGITAIVIALVTISFQAIRAAVANPVKSLKAE